MLWEYIAMSPPLCTMRAEVDEMLEIMTKTIKSVAEMFPEKI